MLQVLLHRPIQYTPKLFILQLSNWPALSRAHRVFFWPMRMSNWRHNGVCSSFQQRQRHCQSYLHSIQHGFHPTRRPAGCVETMSQTLWVGNGLASRPPCHELRNLCATDNEQRRCQCRCLCLCLCLWMCLLPDRMHRLSTQHNLLELPSSPARAT